MCINPFPHMSGKRDSCRIYYPQTAPHLSTPISMEKSKQYSKIPTSIIFLPKSKYCYTILFSFLIVHW